MFPLGVLKRKGSKTVLLMPFSQTSQFDDLSEFNHLFNLQAGTVTIVPDADSSTGHAARFQNALLNTPHSPALELGATDFTIEFFIKQNILSSNNGVLGVRTGVANEGSYNVSLISNRFVIQVNGTPSPYAQIQDNSGFLMLSGVRYHVAFVRQGTTLKIYVDGQLRGQGTVSVPFANGTAPFGIGSYYSTSALIPLADAKLDNLRIRKEAVYTSNFIPPTAPFTS